MKCGQAPCKSSTAPWWPVLSSCDHRQDILTCRQLLHMCKEDGDLYKEDGDKRDKQHQGDLSPSRPACTTLH